MTRELDDVEYLDILCVSDYQAHQVLKFSSSQALDNLSRHLEHIPTSVLRASSLDPRAASIKRVLIGNARTEGLDSAGRLLIAPELREYAQFQKTVFLVGMGSHFEIWSEAGWKQQNDLAAEALLGDLPPGLGDLVL